MGMKASAIAAVALAGVTGLITIVAWQSHVISRMRQQPGAGNDALSQRISALENGLTRLTGAVEQEKRQRADWLRSDLEQQRRTVDELAAGLSQLDVSSAESASASLDSGIQSERQLIASLEQRERADRDAIDAATEAVRSSESDGTARKEALLAEYEGRIAELENELTSFRQKLNAGATVEDIKSIDSRQTIDRSELAALRAGLAQIEATDFSAGDRKGSLVRLIADARADLEEVRDALDAERAHRDELEDQARGQRRSIAAQVRQKERLADRLDFERRRLQRLQERQSADANNNQRW